MFGAIPAGMLVQLAVLNGAYFQLPLFETPPEFEIDEECLCSIPRRLTIAVTEHGGQNCGGYDSVDHPSFLKLRAHMESHGFITTSQCVNGDQVTKEFFLNGKFFEVGERFPSASAMKHSLKRKPRGFSSGKLLNTPLPDGTVPDAPQSNDWW